jgi:3',5'-nucleoside bisphosphate phosphatase
MIKPGIQSLHSHTLLSDGHQTHSQVLDTAEKAGFSVIVFTDHDALPNNDLLKDLKKKQTSVKWSVGIEISSGLPKELDGQPNGPHMLGLFVDPFNEKLLEYCKKTQEDKTEKFKKIIKKLNELGFDLTIEETLSYTTGTLNSPNLVSALRAKDKNIKLMDEFVQQLKKEAEANPKAKIKYDLMMDLGENQYPYSLFLGADAYFSVDVPSSFRLDFDQSVKLIRDAGGLAFIAHYTYTKKDLPWEILEKLLKENRVDGAEAVYGLWNRKSNFRKEIEQDREKIKELLKKYQKLAAGGADSHYGKDLVDFANDQELSSETVGLVEEIIKRTSRDYSGI